MFNCCGTKTSGDVYEGRKRVNTVDRPARRLKAPSSTNNRDRRSLSQTNADQAAVEPNSFARALKKNMKDNDNSNGTNHSKNNDNNNNNHHSNGSNGVIKIEDQGSFAPKIKVVPSVSEEGEAHVAPSPPKLKAAPQMVDNGESQAKVPLPVHDHVHKVPSPVGSPMQVLASKLKYNRNNSSNKQAQAEDEPAQNGAPNGDSADGADDIELEHVGVAVLPPKETRHQMHMRHINELEVLKKMTKNAKTVEEKEQYGKWLNDLIAKQAKAISEVEVTEEEP